MQLNNKEMMLSTQYQSMSQEIKKLEGAYTWRFSVYEKSYRAAFDAHLLFKELLQQQQQQARQQQADALSSLSPSSAPSPEPVSRNSRYSASISDPPKPPPSPSTSGIAGNSFSPSGFRLDMSSFTSSLPPSLTSLVEKSKKADILNWMVSSTSTTTTAATTSPDKVSPKLARYETAGDVASRALTCAEINRRAARKAWLEYIVVAHRFVLKAQILMTRLQSMQESFVMLLQDHMCKMIVFESSALANQQYDIRMLFKVPHHHITLHHIASLSHHIILHDMTMQDV